jgi:hypothetical protein
MAVKKSRVEIHHAPMKVEVGMMTFNSCRKALRFVHLRAKRGAMGGPYSRTQDLATTLAAVGPVIIPTGVDGSKSIGIIFSPLDYAASVEAGAKIHPIFPKGLKGVYRYGSKAKPQLSFVWHGRRVFTPQVPMVPWREGRSHPGQKGRRFLQKAMIAGSIRYGFVYTPGPLYLT